MRKFKKRSFFWIDKTAKYSFRHVTEPSVPSLVEIGLVMSEMKRTDVLRT
jgi:hypothetical protein